MSSLFIHHQADASTFTVLNDAAQGAVGGLGHFAWATRSGLRLFTEAPGLSKLLDAGELELVIGTDAITDARALKEAELLSATFPGFSARFFVHEEARIFHPKFCLFWAADGTGRLVIGSGNLTRWGLTENWEAGVCLSLEPGKTEQLKTQMRSWEAVNLWRLHPAGAEQVRARVAANRPFERAGVRKQAAVEAAPEGGQGLACTWLLMQLTKGRGTYKQTSVPRTVAVNYFGFAAPGVHIDFRFVDDDANLGDLERRWLGGKNSANYAFDLAAAADASSPVGGPPPVALFAKDASGAPILYTIVSAGEPGFDGAQALLAATNRIPDSGVLQRSYVTRHEVEAHWPDCALLRA